MLSRLSAALFFFSMYIYQHLFGLNRFIPYISQTKGCQFFFHLLAPETSFSYRVSRKNVSFLAAKYKLIYKRNFVYYEKILQIESFI